LLLISHLAKAAVQASLRAAEKTVLREGQEEAPNLAAEAHDQQRESSVAKKRNPFQMQISKREVQAALETRKEILPPLVLAKPISLLQDLAQKINHRKEIRLTEEEVLQQAEASGRLQVHAAVLVEQEDLRKKKVRRKEAVVPHQEQAEAKDRLQVHVAAQVEQEDLRRKKVHPKEAVVPHQEQAEASDRLQVHVPAQVEQEDSRKKKVRRKEAVVPQQEQAEAKDLLQATRRLQERRKR
jgi:hypothetical protein